jgi:hypothetical protein
LTAFQIFPRGLWQHKKNLKITRIRKFWSRAQKPKVK